MDSDAAMPLLSIGWRAALALGLAVLAAYLLASTQYYATIVLLGLVILSLMFGATQVLLKSANAADGRAADRAIAHLLAQQKQAARAQDHLQALLDTVSAVLLVLKSDGRAEAANRAAQLLLRDRTLALHEAAAIGPDAAAAIIALAPGARAIVQLANGQQMLAAAANFAGDGQSSRLVSLQAVVGELDAVQLKAWQDMSRVLSHEIMNSLTPIASLSESLSGLLRSEAASHDSIEAVDTIARRSHGLVDFVGRYRQMAELPQPRLRVVSLQDFAGEMERLMAGRLATVAYRSRVEPESLSVTADPDLLSQAVINLLHNAVDAVAARPDAAIELACARHGEEVVVSVSDNGTGVAESVAKDIFVPFFTTKSQGSGIGLSIVRQIALKHGGRVDVQPSPGGGTTFRLILPQN